MVLENFKLEMNNPLNKTLLLFTVIFSFLIISSCGKDEPPDPRANDYVYVCTSNSAKTYHTLRDCSGLKNCSKDILEVTRRETEKENKADTSKK
jgi:hypothetical protein